MIGIADNTRSLDLTVRPAGWSRSCLTVAASPVNIEA